MAHQMSLAALSGEACKNYIGRPYNPNAWVATQTSILHQDFSSARKGPGMTLRQKILLLGLIALLGMGMDLVRRYGDYHDQALAIETIASRMDRVRDLALASHELQRERGLQIITAARKDDPVLQQQQNQTDERIRKLNGTLPDYPAFKRQLADLRIMAEGQESLAIRDRYAVLIRDLLDQMSFVVHGPTDIAVRDEIAAHTHLREAKEYLGLMRATLGLGINRNQHESRTHHQLIYLSGQYQEALRKFRRDATPTLRQQLDLRLTEPDVAATLALISQVVEQERIPGQLTKQQWWGMASLAMDAFKTVEELSLDSVKVNAEARIAALRQSIYRQSLLTLGLSLAIVVFTLSTVAGLIRSLGRMLVPMTRITESQDFSLRLPENSRDEIGLIGKSFNQLLDVTEHLLAEQEYLATRDPLTGIYNRRHFNQVLNDEIERKLRHAAPMSLILFDVDHFKRVNDRWGHDVGDEVLKAITGRVDNVIRSVDVFGRWGGEEFVILLRDEAGTSAAIMAEKLRTLIANEKFSDVGTVTCSFGIADWHPGDSDTRLIKRADEALYAAKKAGRNRIVCHQDNGNPSPAVPIAQQEFLPGKGNPV